MSESIEGAELIHHELKRGKPFVPLEDNTPLEASKWPKMPSEARHGLVGEFVELVEPHTEADPNAVLLQCLVLHGNVAGRYSHYRVEDDRHGTNLFLVLSGETSRGRKGTSLGRVRAVYDRIDPEWSRDRLQYGLSSGDGLIYAVRDATEEMKPVKENGRLTGEYEAIVTDQGVSDKRLCLVDSEFASTLRVLSREGNTLSAIVRKAWDDGNLQSLTKNSPARATDAHISLIGHITKDELLRYLSDTEAANGFGNRFLWACVRRSKFLPDGGRPDSGRVQALAERIGQAVAFAQSAGEVRKDAAASEIWRGVYPKLTAGHPGLLGAMTARSEAQVIRLACIYALLDQSTLIKPEHLFAGLAVWDYCEASARYIFGEALGDPVADEILKASRLDPGISRTEISNLFGRNQARHRIAGALNLLLGQNLLRMEKEKTAGRSVERFYPTGGSTKQTK